MKRRVFLSGLSLGISGCIQSVSGARQTTEGEPVEADPDQQTLTTQAQTANTNYETDLVKGGPETVGYLREVEVTSVDPSPSEQTAISVTVDGGAITTNQTVVFSLEVTNTADHPREFGFGAPPFIGMNSEESSGWLLFPIDQYQRDGHECWYPAREPLYVKTLTRESLQPGESHTEQVELWSRQPDPCMPTGQFRFQGGYYEYEQGAGDEDKTDGTRYEWGFEITVSDWSWSC